MDASSLLVFQHLVEWLTHSHAPICRAQKLIAGLGGEKSRWTAAAERLGREFEQLTGNVLLAAAQIAYLGAFTSAYRLVVLHTVRLSKHQRQVDGSGVPVWDHDRI